MCIRGGFCQHVFHVCSGESEPQVLSLLTRCIDNHGKLYIFVRLDPLKVLRHMTAHLSPNLNGQGTSFDNDDLSHGVSGRDMHRWQVMPGRCQAHS